MLSESYKYQEDFSKKESKMYFKGNTRNEEELLSSSEWIHNNTVEKIRYNLNGYYSLPDRMLRLVFVY